MPASWKIWSFSGVFGSSLNLLQLYVVAMLYCRLSLFIAACSSSFLRFTKTPEMCCPEGSQLEGASAAGESGVGLR